MGLMNAIKRMAENKAETKKKFKAMQEQDRLENMVEERKKSSNRRELEKYYKDKEEAEIKVALEKIRKQKTKEAWKPKNQILKQKTTMLNEDRPILKERNIFKNKKQKLGGCIYFK
jgi:hypothetical protein